MILLLGIIFLLGYAFIAFESKIKIDKAAIAVSLSMILWLLIILNSELFTNISDSELFKEYKSNDNNINLKDYIINILLSNNLGGVSEIFFFLFSAMVIVELIDIYGGFTVITNKILTTNKLGLLWILAFLTFFLSAVIDNMTTTIVLLAIVNKLVSQKNDKLLFGSVIVIASNCGGAWSPIGDVTSILLWSAGRITSFSIIKYNILPSLIAMLLPLILVSLKLNGKFNFNKKTIQQNELLIKPSQDHNDKVLNPSELSDNHSTGMLTYKKRGLFLSLGLVGIISIPVFRELVEVPPFFAAFAAMGILWIINEILYNKRFTIFRVNDYLGKIDLSTLLFFVGILMSVSALECSGLLNNISILLKNHLSNVYILNLILGFMSAIIDNVPLVAAALDLFPIVDSHSLKSLSDSQFLENFVVDGKYWLLLNYCAGIGGNILIIGSSAGVVAMGIMKINFIWYLKNISLFAIIGYLTGFLFLFMELYFLK